MVADMVSATGEWDWERLRELLPEEVLDYLAATPPTSTHLGEDVPGWRWDDKREFRVCYAYTILMQVRERCRSSQWNKIWSLQVPQWVKVFMWITAHRCHLTNVERVRRHIASSDICGICHNDSEYVDHILRRCAKARDLWRSVLGQEVASTLDSLPFDDWLHGNFSGRLAAVAGRKDWGMEFSIYCWQLWKLRCSMILDGDFVERESVVDRGHRLILECKATFSTSVRGPVVTSNPEQRWSRNGAADKLASLGWHAMPQGSLLVVPPGPVVVLVAADQQRWEERRMFEVPNA
ncbi:hypothetical protein V6N13_072651 [Hibiscus sabdariffa]